MPYTHLIVRPGHRKGTVISETGELLTPPEDWAFLPSGDAAVTRSVKSKGITWVVQVRKGRRNISKGVWASKNDITDAQGEVEAKRSTPAYHKKRKRDLARRAEKHDCYVADFSQEVLKFLDFHPRYGQEAETLAMKITEHATPVGSGTVARTERIPIHQRAEAATIAWLRHQTTSYDRMHIARIKGHRREVRRHLAEKSKALLQAYRRGEDVDKNCPIKVSLR